MEMRIEANAMREQIVHRLRGSALSEDPVGIATRAIPPGTEHVWFKLPLRPAAVLLALVDRGDGPNLILTERPEHMSFALSRASGRCQAGCPSGRRVSG